MSTPTPDQMALVKRLRGGHVPRTPELDQGSGGPTGHVCGGHGWGYPPDYPCLHVQAADLIERLTLAPGEWRVSVGVDGTRTVTPLEPTHWECTWVNPISGRGCGIYECDGGHYVEIGGRHVWRYHSGRPTAWADAPENGDPT